ncbi:MAG: MFS transporter [Acidiphilium sp. 37-64-53]|uniref:MFS transporter n=1 Tax=Acidiphilium TaxID=522 RepID=UPI000BD90D66|nr:MULTISPECIES: MFS transporter [Acidiphilium]OYW02612.1 MAG: MFS transporter [Acidiphilium sp. 37-64-53]OZB29900.1 MAG: MFS transporter [Acidiphilium sp. 34-64-41]HQT84003.1 MFS transporter [Acidiphilium rubrum]
MSGQHSAEIAARLDRLPPSRTVWTIIVLISLGGVFEFYDLFFTGYVAPGMIGSGLFKPASLGVFASLGALKVAGFGTFVFATFAGLWLGALVFSQVADRLGRRIVFTGSLIWYMVCTAIMAFQTTGFALDIWRFIAGIGIGVELVTIDTFISEMIPRAERGRAYSINQMITFAVVPVIAFLAYFLKGSKPFGLDYWRVVILIGSVGALVVFLLQRGIPESPRWLARHGRMAEAEAIVGEIERKVMAETGRALPPPQPAAPEEDGVGSFFEIFSPQYRKRTIILSVFNMAQVIGFYGFAAWVPTLLIHRGIHVTASLEYAFIIAIANPFGPLIGTLFADRLERKTQIIGGLAVMGVVIALFAMSNAPALLIALGVLFTLAANIMSFAYHGYQPELYPTRIRARAVGFVYSWSRLAAAFAGLAIGILLSDYGVPGVAVFIATAMLVGIVMITLGPSTRGLALEQINH